MMCVNTAVCTALCAPKIPYHKQSWAWLTVPEGSANQLTQAYQQMLMITESSFFDMLMCMDNIHCVLYCMQCVKVGRYFNLIVTSLL